MVGILAANSAVSTGAYSIDNSLRFDYYSPNSLSRTLSGSGNISTYTFSTWVKRSNFGNYMYLFSHKNSGESDSYGVAFDISTDKIYYYGGSVNSASNSLRDPAAWYHIVLSVSSGSFNLYVNGSSVLTGTAQSVVAGKPMGIGFYNHSSGSFYFDGYQAEFHFIDGTAKAPTDFGEFDSNSGIWKPKEYTGTYGTNGFYLDFESSGSLGADSSGNSNNFTPTNITSHDQMLDTPTNNFCTLNSVRGPIGNYDIGTLAESNLKFITPNQSIFSQQEGTIFPTSGKWYWEVFFVSSGNDAGVLGIQRSGLDIGAYPGKTANGYGYDSYGSGLKIHNNSSSSYGSSYTTNDIIGVALDLDNGTLTFYKNNSSQGQAFSGIDSSLGWSFSYGTGYTNTFVVNFGQDSSFAGNKTAQNNIDGNGEGDFFYAPPTGFLCLNSTNLATELSPTIDDGSQYFNTVLYTGNGGTNAITGVGFQPDWVWGKDRTGTDNHHLFDTTRGTNQRLISNSTAAENTEVNCLNSFDSDGFTLGSNTGLNNNGDAHVAWNWIGSDSSAVSNTDGSITSTVSANTTAGFSIVTYTGNETQGATVGHGIGKIPEMIIIKCRSQADAWGVYHSSVGAGKYLKLNETSAESTATTVFPTAQTSSIFYLGDSGLVNGNGRTYVAYCFAEIEGYSKMGTYTGNGTGSFGPFAGGTFVYTGFKPAWLMIKRTDGANGWTMFDNKRDPHNVVGNQLSANSTAAEEGDASHHSERDFLSNGFKLKGNGNDVNADGANYLYMAFAEQPFVDSNGVPVTAR